METWLTGSASPELTARLAAARLYVITMASHSPSQVVSVVSAACKGGAQVVQLRRKGDDALETLRLAERCRAVTAAASVLFVVNDRLDVAMAVEADGVHLGQSDLPVAVVRRLWPGRIVGHSTHSLAQAVAAEREGADYLGVGPVFATPTKPGRPAVGLEYVREAASQVGVPWFAIGGIDVSNVSAVLGAGARRIAVVRAVSDAADVSAAARRLLSVVAGVGVEVVA